MNLHNRLSGEQESDIYKLGGSTVSKAVNGSAKDRQELLDFFGKLAQSKQIDANQSGMELKSLVLSVWSGVTDKIVLALKDLAKIFEVNEVFEEKDVDRVFVDAGVLAVMYENVDRLFEVDDALLQLLSQGDWNPELMAELGQAKERARRAIEVNYQIVRSQLVVHAQYQQEINQEFDYRERELLTEMDLQNLAIGFGEDSTVAVHKELLNLIPGLDVVDLRFYADGDQSRFENDTTELVNSGLEVVNENDVFSQMLVETARRVNTVLDGLEGDGVKVILNSGFTSQMEVVGRSYSDMQAAILTIALNGVLTYIKDVDRILTGHPQLVKKSADPIEIVKIHLEKLAALVVSNDDGAPLSAAALKLLSDNFKITGKGVPVKVSNLSLNPDLGTEIIYEGSQMIVDKNGELKEVDDVPQISIMPPERNFLIKIKGIKAASETGFVAKVTKYLADRGVSVHTLASGTLSFSMSVNLPKNEKLRRNAEESIQYVLARLRQEYGDDNISAWDDVTRLTLVSDLVKDQRKRLEIEKLLIDYGYEIVVSSNDPEPDDVTFHVRSLRNGEGQYLAKNPQLSERDLVECPGSLIHKVIIEGDREMVGVHFAEFLRTK